MIAHKGTPPIISVSSCPENIMPGLVTNSGIFAAQNLLTPTPLKYMGAHQQGLAPNQEGGATYVALLYVFSKLPGSFTMATI
ncbi:hypothetical protein RRG08_006549 [Elysia crispata]|uniref:Uncharacterized protein n=1 Tax=Elysia crispata TaxID=231223 RepID=A0AAE1ATU9_9GAST|nr:hypothetical protein RRG08_006549 [Elysia crispata]